MLKMRLVILRSIIGVTGLLVLFLLVFKCKKDTAGDAYENDTNFTLSKYASFLLNLKDTSRYIVVPLNEFRQIYDSTKVIISLRHDVDVSLKIAYEMSKLENQMGFRTTYFILHTADYYHKPNDMNSHHESILPTLHIMQDDFNHEIGWHNDLVTLDLVYKIDPVQYLQTELSWLRGNRINIFGSSSHGSTYCYLYGYLNYYFFKECSLHAVEGFPNYIKAKIGNDSIPLRKGKFSDFNLFYEAYFLNNNKYFSDGAIIEEKHWNFAMLDLNSFLPGDRIIILTHPIHWIKK